MKTLHTDKAPQAVGPYSQAVEAQGFVFVSGQIALDPQTNTFDEKQSIEQQTKQVLENIRAIIENSGCSVCHIVKVEIFVTDISAFKKVNEVYAEFFGEHKPARQTVEVSALPLGAQIEMSCIAAKDL